MSKFKKGEQVGIALLYSGCRVCNCNGRVLYLNSIINHFIRITILCGADVSDFISKNINL